MKNRIRSLPPVVFRRFSIEPPVPVPGQAVFGEGEIEGLAMRLFGVRERPVDVEYQRLQTHGNVPPALNAAVKQRGLP